MVTALKFGLFLICYFNLSRQIYGTYVEIYPNVYALLTVIFNQRLLETKYAFVWEYNFYFLALYFWKWFGWRKYGNVFHNDTKNIVL